MTYLVDANVLSETTKPDPSAQVIDWLRANERDLAVDPIILGEVRFDIHVLSAGKRRRLERWFDQGVANLICLTWTPRAFVGPNCRLAPCRFAMSVKDSMIAANALVH